MNSAGRDLRRITRSPGKDAFPSWSPDGRTLAFASNRTGDWEIYTTNANGSGHLVQVTHRAGVDSLPVWSPDGNRLAFDAPRNGHYQICVVPSGGGTITVLTSGGAAERAAGLVAGRVADRVRQQPLGLVRRLDDHRGVTRAPPADHRLGGGVPAGLVAGRQPDPVRAGHVGGPDHRRDAGRRWSGDRPDRAARERDPRLAAGQGDGGHRRLPRAGPVGRWHAR